MNTQDNRQRNRWQSTGNCSATVVQRLHKDRLGLLVFILTPERPQMVALSALIRPDRSFWNADTVKVLMCCCGCGGSGYA